MVLSTSWQRLLVRAGSALAGPQHHFPHYSLRDVYLPIDIFLCIYSYQNCDGSRLKMSDVL
jgi:hypothetical protein